MQNAPACSLEIMDESSQHAGHAGSRMTAGANGETHFNVKVVSAAFEGQNTVKRHRQVYGVSGHREVCCPLQTAAWRSVPLYEEEKCRVVCESQ